MRLLLLTDFLYDFSTFRLTLENLARVYRARGHRVETAGQRDPRKPPPPIRNAGRPRAHLVGGASFDLARRARTTSRSLPELVRNADAVHLHTAGSWNPILSAVAEACARVPLVVTFQDWENPDLPGNDARGLRRWTRLMSKAAAVTAVSSGTARALSRDMPASRAAAVVPNGVEEPMFEPPARGGRARRPFVLCPARLSAYKGIDVALMAWNDVCSEHDRVDLVFCGPDHAFGRFQRLARRLGLSSRAVFLGPVGRRRMRSLTDSCLFAVLPSRRESFGVAALEAMAAGKALLATRTDGPSDFIAHGENGLLARPGRVEPLRAGLLSLLRDPRLRARLGRAARRTALGYRWEAVADAYLPLYGRGAPR